MALNFPLEFGPEIVTKLQTTYDKLTNLGTPSVEGYSALLSLEEIAEYLYIYLKFPSDVSPILKYGLINRHNEALIAVLNETEQGNKYKLEVFEALKDLDNLFYTLTHETNITYANSRQLERILVPELDRLLVIMSNSTSVYNENIVDATQAYMIYMKKRNLKVPDGLDKRMLELFRIAGVKRLIGLNMIHPYFKDMFHEFDTTPLDDRYIQRTEFLLSSLYGSEAIEKYIRNIDPESYNFRNVCSALVNQSTVRSEILNKYSQDFYEFCVKGADRNRIHILYETLPKEFYDKYKGKYNISLESLINTYSLKEIAEQFDAASWNQQNILRIIREKYPSSVLTDEFIAEHPVFFNPRKLIDDSLFLYISKKTWKILKEFHKENKNRPSSFETAYTILNSIRSDVYVNPGYTRYIIKELDIDLNSVIKLSMPGAVKWAIQ